MKMVKRILAAVLAMLMLLGCAAAEEAELGNFPSRGVLLQLTQEDLDMGLVVEPYMQPIDVDGETLQIPAICFQYIPVEATEEVNAKLDKMYETGNFDAYQEIALEYIYRCHDIARLFLLTDEKAVPVLAELSADLTKMGENDGYTYMLASYEMNVSEKDDPATAEILAARVTEMLNTIQYQPVVISEEELAGEPETVVPNAFPTFTTQDLSGNTVDNSLFAKAELTVLNIWSTTCYPCISEMPELEKWSKEMPENVQMVGLVLDVNTGHVAGIEEAQMICEATGVTYTNLILSEELHEFAAGIIFTPTTIFVDGNGSIVGEPVTGAYVDMYKAFVEEYINAQ